MMTAFGAEYAPTKGMMTSAGAEYAHQHCLTLTGLFNLPLGEGSYLRTVLDN
jgi:hypothetical protein